ncbi:tetratricopeptide repeat protein [Pseudoxanthomonas sp.]|uniref:tetratricopeptide repeat protein n=1 Tax=Pseudoxanthomonas sp. TaxID=1871049 RepID=UPI00262B790A|nr:tetratricopeptide repeat protein [Pseudoxanthomonas sp.]WDS35899.1 MAG: tetratricopeptide repeat protein [Pseudoxanthomonas sp.]
MPAKMRFVPPLLLILAGFASSPALQARQPAKPADQAAGVLEPVLAGEFALQAGKLPDAARWYLQAAEAGHDVGLAELATRISLLANDDARATRALKLWKQRAPESLAMRAAQATLALRDGRERPARRELESLLRDPDPQAWRYALTALGSGGRDPALSAKLLGQLLDGKALPNQLNVWLAFGGLAQSLEQPALAERIVGEVIQRFPVNAQVSLLHASQLRQAGKTDQARQVLENLQQQADVDPNVRLGAAAEFDALGLPTQAAAVLARGPQDTRTYGLRASLLAKADDTDGLARLYDEAKTSNTDAQDMAQRLLLGQIAEYLKRPQEALDWYQGVGHGEHQVEARLRAANVLFQLGRKDEAFASAHAMQADASVDDDARRDAYLLEADLRQKNDDDAGELDALARGLAAYPDDNNLLYSRGLAWERRDRIDRAEADLRRVLVTDPTNTAALNALGYTLADRTDRYKEALELIDRARAAEPDEPAILDSYGWVLYRMGRRDEALVQIRRAFTLMKDPEIAAHLGQLLWEQGNKDEARHYFDEARKLDPDNRSLLRALEKTGA